MSYDESAADAGDVPETKSLLPPLPETPTTPLVVKTIDLSPRQGLQIWKDEGPKRKITIISTPKAEMTATATTTTTAPHPETYSPTIPIAAQFGVSLVEPLVASKQQYLAIQRAQDLELRKTCESLQSSGWLSEAEIARLNRAKEANWARWDEKIRSCGQ